MLVEEGIMIDLCYVNLAKLKLCFSKFLFLSASGLDLTTKKFFSGFGGQNKAALFMLRRFVQSQAQLQLKSTDSHCWHGTAIGPIVPSDLILQLSTPGPSLAT